MLKRISFLVVFLFALAVQAQVILKDGEHLLRGVFFNDATGPRLILNHNTLALDKVILSGSAGKLDLSELPNGIKIEACLAVVSSNNKAPHKGAIIKIRPLSPLEPLIFYSGVLKGCVKQKGCLQFSKPLKNQPLVGDMVMANLPSDYFDCAK